MLKIRRENREEMPKQTFSIFKEKFTQEDLDRIDPRIKNTLMDGS